MTSELPSNGSEVRFPNDQPESEQPAWRRDFPIDWPQDHYVARRDYTKFLVLTSFSFVVGQFWLALKSRFNGPQQKTPPRKQIARLSDVPVGGTLPFNYPSRHDPCLLVRPDENTFLAYNQKCTHLACAVVPELEHGRLHCPCHVGNFDLMTGRVLSGPPNRPLTKVALDVRDGVVFATGIEERT